MKMWRYLLPLFVFIGLAVVLYAGVGKNPRDLPSPLLNKPIPDFSLPVLSDATRIVNAKDLQGQAYLLNVWASWCVTCLHEHPVLQAFAGENKVPLIGLNWKDDATKAQQWLNQQGNPYTLVLVDETGRAGIDFGVYAAPETFLVDAQGIIRYKHVGALTEQVIQHDIMPRLQTLQRGASAP